MDACQRAYGSSGLVALIDLDPDPLDDDAPFIDFRFEESLKLIGRRAHHHVAGLFQFALDHGIGESCDRIDTYFPDDFQAASWPARTSRATTSPRNPERRPRPSWAIPAPPDLFWRRLP